MTEPNWLPLPFVHRGKVRDVYELDARHLVMVATDRLSAFDVVMAEEVPDKGRILTAMSAAWFAELADVAPSHLVSTDIADLPVSCRRAGHQGRIMIVRRADMLPIECIVRGYLAGSAWKEYRASGTIHGEPAPAGMVEAQALPEPRFTPSTKAAEGHDLNIRTDDARALVGEAVLATAAELSLAIFDRAAQRAAARGILLADTKFELGIIDGDVVVADEILTPDSSRLWDAATWTPGTTPVSFDKQPVRDHLERTGWDKVPPPPPLPPEVVEATRRRYLDVYERLTGLRFADWPG